ncbi:hypothetical protein COM18_11655 [Bacillus pseudomycoides]|nr:hypothetical protein COM18_11655 [Bacillus pseudomycoides]
MHIVFKNCILRVQINKNKLCKKLFVFVRKLSSTLAGSRQLLFLLSILFFKFSCLKKYVSIPNHSKDLLKKEEKKGRPSIDGLFCFTIVKGYIS